MMLELENLSGSARQLGKFYIIERFHPNRKLRVFRSPLYGLKQRKPALVQVPS